MSHYSQRRTVLSRALVAISQQLGQAAVKSVSRRSNGGRQSAVGSQSAVSGGDNDDDDDGSELRRRSYLHTAGLAAPAQYYLGGGAACTLQDMRHCRQQRRPQRQQTRRRRWRRQTRRAGCSGVSCVVAWCRQTLGCWQRAQLPSLLPPTPASHTTNNKQGAAGGGARRRRRCQRRRLISGQAQRQQRRQRWPIPQQYCLMGLGGPHREHGVPAPMHAPACYTGGRMTSTATAKAQRRRRRQGALRQQRALSWHLCLFCLTVRYGRGTVMRRHGRARGGCGYSGSGRGGIDFGAAAESDEGRWVRPASLATADTATAGPNTGRDPVRPFSPDWIWRLRKGAGLVR